MIEVVAFDADDTLWHNESHFQETQQRLAAIVERYARREEVEARLEAVERRNIRHFGFGIKGFTLSMIETAIEISKGEIALHERHDEIPDHPRLHSLERVTELPALLRRLGAGAQRTR